MIKKEIDTTTREVSFGSHHKPALVDGEYTITVKQETSLLGKLTNLDGIEKNDLSGALSKTIFVAGERYSIKKNDILNQFPIPNRTGKLANILPHIALKRSTLPWERTSGATLPSNAPLPWMWLFIFNDEDIAKGNVKLPKPLKLKEVYDPISKKEDGSIAAINRLPLITEPGDQSSLGVLTDKTVSVLEMDLLWAKKNKIIPSLEDLALLTSVRKTVTPAVGAEKETTTELAYCLGNRLPKPGVKNYACLLSLENRIDDKIRDPLCILQESGERVENGKTYGSFISLTKWSFNCLPEESYQVTKEGLKKAELLYPVRPNEPSNHENDRIKSINLPGFYANESAFKIACSNALEGMNLSEEQLEKVIKCFAIPSKSFESILESISSDSIQMPKAPMPIGNLGTEINKKLISTANQYLGRGAVALPHQLKDGEQTISWYHGPFQPIGTPEVLVNKITSNASSDELLRFDTELNMLDVSYAAAWELGRFLTLNDKGISMALYSWKRQQVWKDQPVTAVHLSQVQKNKDNISEEEILLKKWFKDLSLLKNIPFNYLVPDERLLPNESIGFFTIDQLWIDSLLNGAFSIGSVPGISDDLGKQNYNKLCSDVQRGSVSGFLLNSEVVSGWPHTFVDAVGQGKESPIRIERVNLAPEIEFCLYQGIFKELDFHLKSEILHFGFEPKTGDQFTKEIRFNVSTGAGQKTSTSRISGASLTNIPNSIFNTENVVDIHALNSYLKSEVNSTTTFTSAEFALEMVQGVPKVKFKIGSPPVQSSFDNFEDDVKNFFEKPSATATETVGLRPHKSVLEKIEDGVEQLFEQPEDIGMSPPKSNGMKVKPVQDNVPKEPPVPPKSNEELDKLKASIKSIEVSIETELKSRKGRDYLVIIGVVLLLMSLSIWTVKHFSHEKQTTPLLLHFQSIKEMNEMEFVKMHYKEIVPVTSEKGALKFLLNIPASITGEIDMTRLSYQYKEDSVVQITLPPVTISDVEVNLTKVTDEYNEGDKIHLFFSGGGKDYSDAYNAITLAIEHTKRGVLSNAIQDDILEKTDREVRAYFIKILGALGYHVEFVRNNDMSNWEKDLETRLGTKLWQGVNHKVKAAKKSIPKSKFNLLNKVESIFKPETK